MWIKKGVIFKDRHAQMPTVEENGDTLRIYYSTKIDGKSNIGYFEVDADDPSKIKYKHEGFVLEPGERGCFDDSGVMPSCITKLHEETYLYYTGWNIDKGEVPYGHGIGLAKKQGDVFDRIWQGPILDRGCKVPFLANSPCVINLNNKQMMFFCNGTGWMDNFPTYKICRASAGPNWTVVENIVGESEEACSRPCVLKHNNNWHMFFSKKTKDTNYKIVYATGNEVFQRPTPAVWKFHWKWEIRDKTIIEPGCAGQWDSDMQCYPWVHVHGDRAYMFYNGNGYGETGIGWAERYL